MTYDCGVALALSGRVDASARRTVSRFYDERILLLYELSPEYHSHVTLYQGRFANMRDALCAWEELKMELVVNKPKTKQLILVDRLEVRKNNNVFWNLEVAPTLCRLHEFVASHMSAFAAGRLLPQASKAMLTATSTEQDRILRYGMLATGEYYHPHVTIARLQHSADVVEVEQFRLPRTTFAPRALYFGVINEFGQMKKEAIVEAWRF